MKTLWSIQRIVSWYFRFLSIVSGHLFAWSQLLHSVWPRILCVFHVVAHKPICIWWFLLDFCSRFTGKSFSLMKVIFNLLSLSALTWMCRNIHKHLSVILSMFWNSWGRLWLRWVYSVRLCLIWDDLLHHFQLPLRDRGFRSDWARVACWCCRETYWDCFSELRKVIVFRCWLWRNIRCWYRVISLLHWCLPLLKEFLKIAGAQNYSIYPNFRNLGLLLDVLLGYCCAACVWLRSQRHQGHLWLSWKYLNYFGLSLCIPNQLQAFHRFNFLHYFDFYWGY